MLTLFSDKKEWIFLDFKQSLIILIDKRFCLLWNCNTEAVKNLMCFICAFKCKCNAFNNFLLY